MAKLARILTLQRMHIYIYIYIERERESVSCRSLVLLFSFSVFKTILLLLGKWIFKKQKCVLNWLEFPVSWNGQSPKWSRGFHSSHSFQWFIVNHPLFNDPLPALWFWSPPNGRVSNGGASRSELVCADLSLFVLVGTFPIFPDFPDLSEELPDFSFSSFSACEQHLQGAVSKGSATQSGPFPKEVGNSPVWKPPGLGFR